MTGTVYGLYDPRTGALRYVGATTGSLATRLAGHRSRSSPAAMRAWLGELRAADLVPRIAALREHVPAAQLPDAERAEIAAGLLAGEALLTEAGVAAGLDAVRAKHRAAHAARVSAAWRVLADSIRATGATVASPWPVDFAVPPDVWDAVVACSRRPPEFTGLSVAAQHRIRATETGDLLLHGVRRAFPRLRDDPELREDIDGCVRGAYAAVAGESEPQRAAAVYLSALPWLCIVFAPWRGLAARAGLPHAGPRVRGVGDRRPGRPSDPLVAGRARAAPGDVTAAAPAHGFAPEAVLAVFATAYAGLRPDPILYEVCLLPVLSALAAAEQLTRPLARLWTSLDEQAVARAYGPDVAADIDRTQQLPAGTAVAVLRELHRLRPAVPHVAAILRRAGGELRTVDRLPLFEDWGGGRVTLHRAAVVSLVRSGIVQPAAGDLPRVESIVHAWRVAFG